MSPSRTRERKLKPPERNRFVPSASQMELWPAISGNQINGLGEKQARRPSPVYWHPPEKIPHGPLQNWFYENYLQSTEVVQERSRRQAIMAQPLPAVSETKVVDTPANWSHALKEVAMTLGADDFGIAAMRKDWVFEGHQVKGKWAIVIAVKHDFQALSSAPEDPAAVEVVRQYTRALDIVKQLTGWIRKHGWDAWPHGGPMAGDVVMIPAAIAAGLGELGKHGSMINRVLGSNFRLGLVLTELPLEASGAEEFGADGFCANCRVCADACPPMAISHDKHWIRGIERWYVDFDACLPFFNEHKGCAICIAVCPWSRPGVAASLSSKLSRT